MKTITFLLATLLLGANVVKATDIKIAAVAIAARYGAQEPIEFNERGIDFFVFPNGEFDFNTQTNGAGGDYYYKGAGRRGAAGPNRRANNCGVLIENDSYGRIRRVGNTFINYDYANRVARIGSVFMRYNRFALVQIGGLQLVYNRFGTIIDSYGSVKGIRSQGFTNSYYGPRNYLNAEPRYNDIDFDNQNATDNGESGTYYYKTDGTKVKDKEEKNDFKTEGAAEGGARK